jgi:hypothetical protein
MKTLAHTYADPVTLENGVALFPGETVTLDDDVAAHCLALAPDDVHLVDAPKPPPSKKEK